MSNITVNRVIEKLPTRFVAENAEDLNAVFQFMLEDDSDFFIQIQAGSCLVEKGEHPDPSISLFMDAETVIEVVTGVTDGMSAFMKGRLRAEGNVILATRLGKLFAKDKQD
ncbi:MAG: SCP2 sterol-binding domain-containing protein [Pontibacterium sp.]